MEMPKRQSSCLLTDKSKAWKCLAGIKLSSLQPNVVAEDFYEEPENVAQVEKNEPDVYTVSNAMICSLCDCKFEDRHQQKAHYRLDWHRFNLKQRMLGQKSVSEEAFSQQADDVSSISGSGDSSSSSEDEVDMSPVSRGSHQTPTTRRKKANSIHKYDSDDDDDSDARKEGGNGRRCPRIYFDNDEGQVVSVYRCILHGKREAPANHTELISRTLGLLTNQKWAIMMTGGGHFAAAVYDGPEVIVHKTFHRYTVRAKRGTVQSVRDSQGNAPKSAGASIRRHNEAALNQEVQDLLASWKDHLDSCTRIFLRVPTYNRAMFYSGKCPALVKGDNRVVTIPFATRRATFKELKRVWEVLATIELHGSIADVTAIMSSPKEKKEWKKGKKSPQKEKLALKEDEASVEVILSRLEKQSLEDECKEDPADNSAIFEKKENQDEQDDGEVDDIELHEEVVITSTDHLKEYETTHKKQKKRKKKKQQSQWPQEDKEEAILTTDLFTICRTGDMDKLEEVICKIQRHFSIPSNNPPNSLDSTKESLDTEPSKTENISPGRPNMISGIDNKNSVPLSASHEIGANEGTNNSSQECCANASDGSNRDHSGNKYSEESQSNLPNTLDSHAVFHEDSQKNPDCVDAAEAQLTKPNVLVVSEFDDSNMPVQCQQVPDADCEINKDKAVKGSDDIDKLSRGVLKFLNKSLDDMGYTFLHVAAEDGQRCVLYRLMECGADPGVKNKKGKPAFGCSLDKKTREEFRRFRSDHPDRYDYERAQIPVPLTEEQEKEKAAKQSERKRNARRAKRLKEKDLKEAREEERKEKEKKDWYANLSDREKRALAAEKRFAKQVTSSSDLQRCWVCGSSLAGKVPFSYMDFKFCSMPCLKKHKQQP